MALAVVVQARDGHSRAGKGVGVEERSLESHSYSSIASYTASRLTMGKLACESIASRSIARQC